MTKLKKFLTILFTMLIVINSLNLITVKASNSAKAVGNAWYTIILEDGDLAEYQKPANKNVQIAIIPDTVKIGRKIYKVSDIADNAFKNCKKLKKVTIGKNVSVIGINAFYGCKNLKSIMINSKAIADYSVGTNAFKGINKKAVVTVPSEKLACYKAILKSRGFSGKVQKAGKDKTGKDEKREDANNSVSNYHVSSKSCFAEENCFFNIRTDSSTSTSGYSSGDVIPFQTKFQLAPGVYGRWEEDSRKLSKGYVKCARCGKCFTDFMLAFHNVMELSTPGGCWGNYYIGLDGQQPTTWAFIPDKNPCKIVLKYTFPQGVSYKDGSFKMTRWVSKNDVTDFCEIRSSGNELVVTISDIKSAPFYNAFKYEEYKKNLYYDPYDSDKGSDEGDRDAFLVKFDTEVESSVSAEGVVLSTMTCTNGSTSHTDSYNISVRTASMQISNTDASGSSLSGAEFDIYQKKTRYPAGSNMGTSDWELFKSGVHAGDIITGMGTGTDAFDNQYKVVQTKAPNGYEEAYDTEFELFISENGTVTAENEEGDDLEVRNGTVQVNVVNDER